MSKGKAKKVPKHVAIIMDGNRRWAAERGLGAMAGHKRVVEKVLEPLIEKGGELGIEYMTFWAWSSENWSRPEKEVGGIMKLFVWALKHKVKKLIEKGARLRVIGDTDKFSKEIREGLEKAVKASEKNTEINVTLAINYGGRDEILRAVKRAVVVGHKPDDLNKETLAKFLDTAGMPDPDLIIRPGGAKRLSGFMLWQSEYSELYFTDVLMPDFGPDELEKVVGAFGRRSRRYGGGSFESYVG